MNKSFPDPSSFKGTEEEILAKVREVRDEIQEWVDKTFCKEEPSVKTNGALAGMRGLLK